MALVSEICLQASVSEGGPPISPARAAPPARPFPKELLGSPADKGAGAAASTGGNEGEVTPPGTPSAEPSTPTPPTPTGKAPATPQSAPAAKPAKAALAAKGKSKGKAAQAPAPASLGADANKDATDAERELLRQLEEMNAMIAKANG